MSDLPLGWVWADLLGMCVNRSMVIINLRRRPLLASRSWLLETFAAVG